jgi:hypothetical protein
MNKLIAITVLLTVPACAIFKPPEIPEQQQYEATLKPGGTTQAAFARAVADGDAAWAKRAEGPDQIRKAVESWKHADAIDPYDRHVLQHLALASYYIANYYTPAEKKPEVHEEGYGFGVRAARLNPDVRHAMDVEKKSLEDAVTAHATPGDVPGLYWMTVNRGRAYEDASIAKRASIAPVLKTIMEKIYKIGPEYYWGGVHRFFGVYYMKAPAQSDPLAQSKREFERAVAIGPENLENKVLYAEYAAKGGNDRALYEKLLKEVLATKPENDLPALRVDNAEARKRAQKMLETIDEDF